MLVAAFALAVATGLVWLSWATVPGELSPLRVDLNGASIAHRYDGHGALSAGASSRLLQDYPPEQRDEILDILFKPSYGMSLDVLKVEIGGDTQSTDGTEPSHARTREEMADCNVERGYETWLLSEAKKRNPEIVVSALAWGVPGWVNSGTAKQPQYFNRDNIEYQVSWVKCVKDKLGITTDYLGIWNERPWGNKDYVVELRDALDQAGFNKSVTGIVMLDGAEQPGFKEALLSNATFAASIEAVGLHYPCNHPDKDVVNVAQKKFWASEDFSTPADWSGAGCWGRVLNSNYVRMNMTSTISWSLLWSVYPNLDCFGNGLMYAFEPWSGHYTINPTVWTTAHTTQFVKTGWHYLRVGPGGGSGVLPTGGGTYVTMREKTPDGSAFDWTMIVETLTGQCLYNSGCFSFGTWRSSRLVEFHLAGFEAQIAGKGDLWGSLTLKFWMTNSTHQFIRLPDIHVSSIGSFVIEIAPDSIYTVTTTSGQSKLGKSASRGLTPPASAPFPLPYADNFDTYPSGALARYWSDQAGVFEVRPALSNVSTALGGVLQQVVQECPIQWAPNPDPFTIAGGVNWTDYTVSVDARIDGLVSHSIPSSGCGGASGSNSMYVSVCGRIGAWAGFGGSPVSGYCLRLAADGKWTLSAGWPTVLSSGAVFLRPQAPGHWHRLELVFSGTSVKASIDGKVVAQVWSTTFPIGLAALSSGWHAASFDNFQVSPISTPKENRGLLEGMQRLTFDYNQRTCTPHPTATAPLRNNFAGKVGLALKVSGGQDVVVSSLMRFVVDQSYRQHQLELLEVQMQSTLENCWEYKCSAVEYNVSENCWKYKCSTVVVATTMLDLTDTPALPLDNLGFASASLEPVVLKKGKTYYLVSNEVMDGDKWLDQLPVSVNAKSGLTILGSVYSQEGETGYRFGRQGSYSYGPLSLYIDSGRDVQYI